MVRVTIALITAALIMVISAPMFTAVRHPGTVVLLTILAVLVLYIT